MAGQKAFSFDYDTYLEVVTKENQKLGLASSGTMTVNRPDKIRATRMGGFADVEFVFDGRTVTMFGKNANAYTQVEARRHDRSIGRQFADQISSARCQGRIC